ncbi:hypothetical protein F4780DRAFT_789966 [Xylariomycetidae sp. FL0641]|nr:hypothetical protein F4780DRAFT_789966 [Xylariomycetidae sp. FL0641]
MFLPDLAPRQYGGPDNFPCPDGNGTMIGSIQQFIVFCGTRFEGTEINRQKADSLTQCAELCTSAQNPRCDGVEFKFDHDCVFIGGLVASGTRPSRVFDSAAGIFLPAPPPPRGSECGRRGGSGAVARTSSSSASVPRRAFELRCDRVRAGADLEQRFAAGLDACLDACAAAAAGAGACGGVSYDPAQTRGFKNCYLKASPFTGEDLVPLQGVDSAILLKEAEDEDEDAGSEPPPPTATSALSPAESVVTVSVPVGSASFTSSSSSARLASPAPPPTSTRNAAASATGSPLAFPGSASSSSTTTTSSAAAWIAAPVIGGVAAVTLILAVFIVYGRRRRQQQQQQQRSDDTGHHPAGLFGRVHRGRAERDDGGEKPGLGTGKGTAALPRGRLFGSLSAVKGIRLPDVAESAGEEDDRPPTTAVARGGDGGFRVVSGSGRRLGLEPLGEIGTGPGLGGMIAAARAGADGGGARKGNGNGNGNGAKEDTNPLGQNRLTRNWGDAIPGIPAGFAGPGR